MTAPHFRDKLHVRQFPISTRPQLNRLATATAVNEEPGRIIPPGSLCLPGYSSGAHSLYFQGGQFTLFSLRV